MRKLFVGFSLFTMLMTSSAFADSNKLFEIGGTYGGPFGVKHYNETDFDVDYSPQLNGRASFNLWLIEGLAEGSYARIGEKDRFEARGHANLWFLDVHELYLRKDEIDGDQKRGMAGIKINAPKKLPLFGELSIGAGYMFMNWQRPGVSENTMHAAYAKGTLHTRIWKFDNELRVALYWAPKVTEDWQGVITGDSKIIEENQFGVIASERLYMEAFRIPLANFGPEIRAQATKLPDGTEWLATIGVGGTFRPLLGL